LIGSNQYRDYLIHKIYQDSPSIVWQKYIFGYHGLNWLLRSSKGTADLCVAVLPDDKESSIRHKFDFKSFESIGHLIDVSQPWDVIRKSFSKNARRTERQIQENKLSYRISKDIKDFDFFYHRMYAVYAKLLFGPFAILLTYEKVREYFERGFLMFILQDEKPIAGRLAYPDGETLVCQFFGLLDGDKNYARIGAQRALYYFTIEYSKSIGLNLIDPKSSRAFLDDDVYRHKREWGSEICRCLDLKSSVYFFNLGSAAQVHRFYEQNPLVISTDNGLGVVVGQPASAVTGDATYIKKLSDNYFAPGLYEAYVLTENSPVPQRFPLASKK
jgi:hypothetical protein